MGDSRGWVQNLVAWVLEELATRSSQPHPLPAKVGDQFLWLFDVQGQGMQAVAESLPESFGGGPWSWGHRHHRHVPHDQQSQRSSEELTPLPDHGREDVVVPGNRPVEIVDDVAHMKNLREREHARHLHPTRSAIRAPLCSALPLCGSPPPRRGWAARRCNGDRLITVPARRRGSGPTPESSAQKLETIDRRGEHLSCTDRT